MFFIGNKNFIEKEKDEMQKKRSAINQEHQSQESKGEKVQQIFCFSKCLNQLFEKENLHSRPTPTSLHLKPLLPKMKQHIQECGIHNFIHIKNWNIALKQTDKN